jgi:predicted transport protein
MIIFLDGKRFAQYSYNNEDEFEKDVSSNAKKLFGENIIYINTKLKMGSKSLGGSIPDGFLFDFTDVKNSYFYLVEIELSTHDFYRHIFPQITKFFSSIKDDKNRTELVEKIFSMINSDKELKNEFKAVLGEKEIYKFIRDTIETNRNILLILDGEKEELPEIQETYNETWGRTVRILTIQKYVEGTRVIFSLNPDIRDIEYIPDGGKREVPKKTQYSESMHLDDLPNEMRELYFKIKQKASRISSEIYLNVQKYYISIVFGRNIAFITFRKNRIEIVILLPEKEIRKRLKHHEIKSLSEGVQRYYNGPCAAVILSDSRQLDEVISLIRYLVNISE